MKRKNTSVSIISRFSKNEPELRAARSIFREHFTGTTHSRPIWDKLINLVKSGGTIVFDSVSRKSRNATEGFQDYKKLYE